MQIPMCMRNRERDSAWLPSSRLPGRLAILRSLCLLLSIALAEMPLPAQSAANSACSDPMLADTPQCSSLAGDAPVTQGFYGTSSGNLLSPLSAGPTNAMRLSRAGNQPGDYFDMEPMSSVPAPQPAPVPPEPLTEFQKFIASSTRQILPIYGASLFRRIPSTFAPLNMAPVPPDYVIGPGDELRVRVWGQVNFQANLRVDRSGEVYLPQVGPTHVAGLAFAALDAHLREAVGRVYRNFDLTADLGQIRAIQVYVAGQARSPGVYTVSSLSTLVDALFASGGPSVQGSLRSIALRRNGAVIARFDLYDLLIRGDKSRDAKLLPGDVLYIPPVGSEVAVLGSVRNPAIYELLPGESLGALLADAGGMTSVAAGARVSIERIEERRGRRAMEVACDAAGLATALHDGDAIRVFPVTPRFEKTVTLRGNIATPGRFAWHQGMRLSELIPDKESLLTRDYWWRRAQMGLPAPEFEPVLDLAGMRQPAGNYPVAIRPREPRWEWRPQQRREAAGSRAPSGSAPDRFGGQDAEGSADQSPADVSGDPAGSPLGIGQEGLPDAQERGGSSSLAGAQSPAPSQVRAPGRRTDVRLPAPEIDWDYAVIERVNQATLRTELIPFDLGKLVLQHDAGQDLELEPGDIVSIFSQADIRVPVAEETKLVRLEGEFAHAGVYAAQPGETLRHLVERAGGLTPNAYLYGSQFTRESTRDVQQARIDEYVQSLSMAIQRNSIWLASSSAVAAPGMTGGAEGRNGEQGLLASLRRIRATGRIVLAFRPGSTGEASLPGLQLEDGDRFVVPHTPATVNVVGAVYDQNSFLFRTGSRAGFYLRQAGGPTHDADRRREFLIRADGEVVSRDTIRIPWGDAFNDLPIYPGDTIVVPEKMLKPSALAGFANWSQMFSQFALGAAALSVMH